MAPKRFVFRLQTVLNVKLKIEEEEKRKFGDLMDLQRREEQRLVNMQAEQLTTRNTLREKQLTGEGFKIDELQRINNWIKKLENDIKLQRQKLVEIAQAIEVQRKVMTEAVIERKKVETLKEQHYEAFVKEVEEEESKMVDELATLKYARNPGQTEE